MPPVTIARWNLTIRQGEDWKRLLTCTAAGTSTPYSFTGHTFRMQIRRNATALGALMIELSTSNGKITSPGAGQVQLHLDEVDTASLDAGLADYDLVANPPSGEPFYLAYGTATIQQGITRDDPP